MKTAPWPNLLRSLVAILRGVQPAEAVAIGKAVFEAGIEAIEVPLNSPHPFSSIERLASALPASAWVGAGTVLKPQDVVDLSNAGGRLVVSPNIDETVLAKAADLGMVTMPGVFTPTEALAALRAGASALKFFPASVLGPKGIAAIRAVLPAGAVIGAVGGVSEKDFADYASVGVRTFGLGSGLYSPGLDAATVGARAHQAVSAWDRVFERRPNG